MIQKGIKVKTEKATPLEEFLGGSMGHTEKLQENAPIRVIRRRKYQRLLDYVIKSIDDSDDIDHEDVETLNGDDYELEQLLNMLRIPVDLEKFMVFALVACFDCFLYYFTILPIRIVYGFKSRNLHRNWLSKTYRQRCTLFLILCSSLVLYRLDTSKVYHRVKRQSAMKLYMLFNVLEIGDKMLGSMGQSLVGVLLSKDAYRHERHKQAVIVLLCTIYLISHGYVLIYQSIAINVAMNSYSNSLLTLLLSIHFAEIRAAVFKKFDKEGLFQLSMADIVERFKLVIILLIVFTRNIATNINSLHSIIPIFCYPMLHVIGSSIIVDWIKHAYITKFNRIRPQIYDKYHYILFHDHATSLKQYQERLGLSLPAYVVLFIVMVYPTLRQFLTIFNRFFILQSLVIITLAFIVLIMVRLMLHTLLRKWGETFQAEWEQERKNTQVNENQYVPGMLSEGMGKMDNMIRTVIHSEGFNNKTPTIMCSPPKTPKSNLRQTVMTPPSLNDKRQVKDTKNPNSLENVTRFKMVSKNIW